GSTTLRNTDPKVTLGICARAMAERTAKTHACGRSPAPLTGTSGH
ncbi:MAG: hypothetical protein H0U32_11805, partial [Thermoleophilaceae bacterium]|nr:hypothetical protein [Thermoleophilaceae bacterium]